MKFPSPLLPCLAALALAGAPALRAQHTPPAESETAPAEAPATPAPQPATEVPPAPISPPPAPASATLPPAPATDEQRRSGLDIHQRFRAHLAEPECNAPTARWQAHFAHAPRRLANPDDTLLPVFGYVVDEFIRAGLPTEYALIPFIESDYNPAARSSAGPAGMWQFIATTARNQGITMQGGLDGRYSVVESTRAAIRYLKILHSMFGGNWRVAVMGYNAGEYRVINAIRQSGQSPRSADAARISAVPAITRQYVEKLHAISCLLVQAESRPGWQAAMAREVAVLAAVSPAGHTLEGWARAHGHDPALLRRLNPGVGNRTLAAGHALLAPATGSTAGVMQTSRATGRSVIARESAAAALAQGARGQRPARHTVATGDSLWSISRRYRLSTAELMRLNRLTPTTPLRPGMVLKLDERPQ